MYNYLGWDFDFFVHLSALAHRLVSDIIMQLRIKGVMSLRRRWNFEFTVTAYLGSGV